MNFARKQINSTAEPIDVARELVRQFVEGIGRRPVAASELSRIEHELGSVPLDSREYGLAINRLRNARRYLNSAEFGAAKYELKLLLGVLSLRRVVEPRLRSRTADSSRIP